MKTATGVITCIGLMMVLVSSLASAQDYYGAIAYSESTGKIWGSIDYSSRVEAEEAALDSCGENDCEIMVWFKNSCGAYAQASNGEGGVSWNARYQSQAEAEALTECSARGRNCEIIGSVCTTR